MCVCQVLKSSFLFVLQGGTKAKTVYASLANGTLVVFASRNASEQTYSHSDVTLVSEEEDECVTTGEISKWSNIQVH